jgi:hypothetical protein
MTDKIINLIFTVSILSSSAILNFPAREFRQSEVQHRARSSASRWHTFRSPDNDFIVEFPAKPRRDEDLSGDVAVLRGYSYIGSLIWLSISFQDLGFEINSQQANDLGPHIDEILAAYTKGRGGKVTRVQRLAKNIIELEKVVPSRWSNKSRSSMSRVIYLNSRLYTLGCVPRPDGQKLNKKICRRFFNSFRITGIPK